MVSNGLRNLPNVSICFERGDGDHEPKISETWKHLCHLTIFGETRIRWCLSRLNTVMRNWLYYIAGACRGTGHHDQPPTDATPVLNFTHIAKAEGLNNIYSRTRKHRQLTYKTEKSNKHMLTYLLYLLNYCEQYKWILHSNFHHTFFLITNQLLIFLAFLPPIIPNHKSTSSCFIIKAVVL